MNMKKYIKIFAVIFCTTSMLVSCSLDEDNPHAGDASLTQYSAWAGLQAYCYSCIADQLYTASDWMFASEGGTDMWVVKGNGDGTKDLFYYDGLTTSTNSTNKLFKQCYSMLTTCNTVINEADKVVDKDDRESEMKVLVAETKALRAFYYYLLVTNFGPVTLTLESNASVSGVTDRYPVRTSEVKIYEQIIKDLTEAIPELGVEPYADNKARLTKKAAMGILAKVYAQRAGLGDAKYLKLGDGKEYWKLAAQTAEELINNQAAYGAYLYDDIYDMWADANNRTNKEALWIAAGANGNDDAWQYMSKSNKLSAYSSANAGALEEFWNPDHKPSDKGYFYGRLNSSVWMPTKYAFYCFNPTWDRRWETTFQYAYNEWGMGKVGWVPLDKSVIILTKDICDKYGIDPINVDSIIYPYVDCDVTESTYAGNQFPAYIWPKGYLKKNLIREKKTDPRTHKTTYTWKWNGSYDALLTSEQVGTRKAFTMPYPIAPDDERYNIVAVHTDAELQVYKDAKSRFLAYKISDLYDSNDVPYGSTTGTFPSEAQYAPNIGNGQTSVHMAYPQLHKFNWSFDGCFVANNLQIKTGDMFIMRMAEIYLLAAEAEQKLGNGGKATEYLNVLRHRAARPNVGEAWKLTTDATEDDIFDEYVREMTGEFNRWALLKRHNAFETRLAKYNKRAASKFKTANYNRPISNDFLTTILNSAEYGDNGYGATATSGLKNFGYDY